MYYYLYLYNNIFESKIIPLTFSFSQNWGRFETETHFILLRQPSIQILPQIFLRTVTGHRLSDQALMGQMNRYAGGQLNGFKRGHFRGGYWPRCVFSAFVRCGAKALKYSLSKKKIILFMSNIFTKYFLFVFISVEPLIYITRSFLVQRMEQQVEELRSKKKCMKNYSRTRVVNFFSNQNNQHTTLDLNKVSLRSSSFFLQFVHKCRILFIANTILLFSLWLEIVFF